MGVPTLTLWGRKDETIPPRGVVPKLVSALPDALFRWVEQSGHTPHLEQPDTAAAAINAFVRGDTVEGDSDVSGIVRDYVFVEAIKNKLGLPS